MAPAAPQCPAPQQPAFDRFFGSGRLVVRFTFLDFVDAAGEQPSIVRRACTDSALLRPAGGKSVDYALGSSAPTSEHGEGSDTDDSQRALAAAPDAAPRGACGHARDGHLRTEVSEETRTTLMLRNLPNNYTREMLLGTLDAEGFAGSYDFVYLPSDFARGCSLGYAFVNLVSPGLVPTFQATFEGYRDWAVPTSKVCQVTWSDPHQGLKANLKRYTNSPVMHPSVPDEYKPCLFADGKRVAFPAPGRNVCRPHKRA